MSHADFRRQRSICRLSAVGLVPRDDFRPGENEIVRDRHSVREIERLKQLPYAA